MKVSNWLISAVACATLVACGNSSNGSPVDPGASVPGTEYGQISKGKADAKAVIVEYASATCPHCADLHEAIIKKLDPRIEAGDLRIEFKEFLTEPANVAHASFKIARCAGSDKYFDVLEDVFKNQRGIVIASQNRQLVPALYAVAQRHGLSQEEFKTCLLDQKLHDTITKNWQDGSDKGISSTPTMFLNGKPVDRAIYFDLAAINALIDEANGIEPKEDVTPEKKDGETDDVIPDDAKTDTPTEE